MTYFSELSCALRVLVERALILLRGLFCYITIFKIKTQTCAAMILNGRKYDFEWSDLMVKKFKI